MTVNDRFESTWDKTVAHFNIWKPENHLNNIQKFCCVTKEIQRHNKKDQSFVIFIREVL